MKDVSKAIKEGLRDATIGRRLFEAHKGGSWSSIKKAVIDLVDVLPDPEWFDGDYEEGVYEVGLEFGSELRGSLTKEYLDPLIRGIQEGAR